MIEIRGNGTSTADGTFDAIRIVSPNNVIRGVSIYNALDQIEMFGAAANNNTIVGNYLGTNAAATFASLLNTASAGTGVHLESGSHNNVFGTPALADRNVFDGAPLEGIRIDHERSDANVIQNNIFGLKPNGLGKLPNGRPGSTFNSAHRTTSSAVSGPTRTMSFLRIPSLVWICRTPPRPATTRSSETSSART